jgi:hypothetical protein
MKILAKGVVALVATFLVATCIIHNPFGKANNSLPPDGVALVVYTGDVVLPSGTWRALVEDNWHSDDGSYARSLFLYKADEIDHPSISVYDDDSDGRWDRVKYGGSATNRPMISIYDLDLVVYEVVRDDNVSSRIIHDRNRDRQSPKFFSFVQKE